MFVQELLPHGVAFDLNKVEIDDQHLQLLLTSRQRQVLCPDCSQSASRVHSRYTRTLADLPWAGRRVELLVRVRRFFCDQPKCARRTFAEALAEVALRYARRTTRLVELQRRLGLVVGGEAGARHTPPLAVPLSADTLLRLIRHPPERAGPSPRVLGIDDWAYRKGYQYGTLLIDLEQGHPVDLLPEREEKAVTAWLQQHLGIEIITRDRAQVYIDAAPQGAPQARRVADRFHLLVNLRQALERFFDRHPGELRKVKLIRDPAPREPTHNPAAKSPAIPAKVKRRPLQQDSTVIEQQSGRRARRQARFDELLDLRSQGYGYRRTARVMKMSINTVRRWLRQGHLPPGRGQASGQSKAVEYAEYLHARWTAGCHSPRQLRHEVGQQGFTGSEASVWCWLLHLRRAEAEGGAVLDVRPRAVAAPHTYSFSSRQAAWALVRSAKPMEDSHTGMTKSETTTYPFDHFIDRWGQPTRSDCMLGHTRAVMPFP